MADHDLLVGAHLARRYRLTTLRPGSSSSSRVYDAVDDRDGSQLVVRVATAESLIDLDAGVLSAGDAAELFKRQTQMLAAMHHPAIARIVDWGTEVVGGLLHVFTVVEHYPGGTLREFLDRGRRLSASQALVVGLDVCRALHMIHSKGWVHGDVRPANIFLGDDGRVRLAGLGQKRATTPESMSLEQSFYVAPEVAVGGVADAKSDIYSLSLTLLELVTGSVPFASDTVASTLAARVDALLPVSADLGPIAAPLERAARPAPEDRSSALEFGQALAAIAGKLPLPEPIETLQAKRFEEVIEQREQERTGELQRPVFDEAAAVDKPVTVVSTPSGVTIADDTGSQPLVIASPTEVKRHVAGMQQAEALNVLAPFKWNVVVTAQRSEGSAAGTVLGTDPEAGADLAEGSTLTMFVSEGEPLATLPDLTGVPEADAIAQLETLGLVPNVVRADNEDIPAGAVISWVVPEQPSIVAGGEVLRGTGIDVTVSNGPAMRDVPLIVGMTLEQAQAALAELRLTLLETPPSKSNAAAQGLIGAQSPPPGEKVARDSQVAYSISLGPDLVALPNIIGNNISIVEPRLTEAGFVVGKVTGRQQNKLRKALVGGQEVGNGDEIPAEAATTVDVVSDEEQLHPPSHQELGIIDSGGVDEISVIPWSRLLRRTVTRRVSMTHRKATLLVLLASVFTVSFTITLLVVSLKTVADDVGTSVSVMSWVITGPLLAFGVVGPAFGKAGDLWGHKRLFVFGLVGAAIFALGSAFAWNALSLIILRTLSAASGSATGPAAMAYINRLFDDDERVR
ncbi:MAG: MFS transporter, partial [Actinobacteria bacterium]|nr:MFS transporter [Actinomycetota bacterium]